VQLQSGIGEPRKIGGVGDRRNIRNRGRQWLATWPGIGENIPNGIIRSRRGALCPGCASDSLLFCFDGISRCDGFVDKPVKFRGILGNGSDINFSFDSFNILRDRLWLWLWCRR
jgi:hypothetical protein